MNDTLAVARGRGAESGRDTPGERGGAWSVDRPVYCTRYPTGPARVRRWNRSRETVAAVLSCNFRHHTRTFGIIHEL